ncbi:MAG: transketolase C-terminal domain-containing protein [Bacillota bacterium]|nr:transketolase C-terminal domain-containing protein [Bacillota bacterium]
MAKATREAYGEALVELAAQYDFLVMDADLSKATKTDIFNKAYPDRFIECGIAEGNMMSVAAGIATTGMPVFASTFAAFAAGRAFDSVRNSIGYPHLNVKIGATHAGISVGEDGATHQCNEDIALMRTIPGMVVINPCDEVEAKAAVKAALLHNGPVYLRFGRLGVPTLMDESSYKFELGKGVVLADGKDAVIFSTGLLTSRAMEAREMLLKEGIDAAVVNIHTIKPIDEKLIIEYAKKTGAVVTAEEHNIIGGLGGAVCEVLAENCPVPVSRVGVNDVFGKSGPALKLLDIFGLNASNIAENVKKVISRK